MLKKIFDHSLLIDCNVRHAPRCILAMIGSFFLNVLKLWI